MHNYISIEIEGKLSQIIKTATPQLLMVAMHKVYYVFTLCFTAAWTVLWSCDFIGQGSWPCDVPCFISFRRAP